MSYWSWQKPILSHLAEACGPQFMVQAVSFLLQQLVPPELSGRQNTINLEFAKPQQIFLSHQCYSALHNSYFFQPPLPKQVSQKTSQLQVRLVFRFFAKVTQQRCNANCYGPPFTFQQRSPCFSKAHLVSRLRLIFSLQLKFFNQSYFQQIKRNLLKQLIQKYFQTKTQKPVPLISLNYSDHDSKGTILFGIRQNQMSQMQLISGTQAKLLQSSGYFLHSTLYYRFVQHIQLRGWFRYQASLQLTKFEICKMVQIFKFYATAMRELTRNNFNKTLQDFHFLWFDLVFIFVIYQLHVLLRFHSLLLTQSRCGFFSVKYQNVLVL
eukprot:TRINITY_DN2295_c1_g1_i1.p1 TRINITY_DN2295_c1_g1~~TRINITY_DN2295_c1_g1_i1.p1  ORF type:complete len:323 (-),score=-35.53 TRINITY_DN2295_c1_g1_i1:140-1108(-)